MEATRDMRAGDFGEGEPLGRASRAASFITFGKREPGSVKSFLPLTSSIEREDTFQGWWLTGDMWSSDVKGAPD